MMVFFSKQSRKGDAMSVNIFSSKKENRYSDSRTDFRKQLKWHIKNPPEGSVPMLITCDMASKMLELNVDNRPCSKTRIAHYARQMKAGEWVHTGQPIMFSDAGRLIDGQHRLRALEQAGVSATFDVRFGVQDRAFSFIDLNKPRSPGDIFSIRGVKNSSNAAAVARIVAHYDEDRISGFARKGGLITPNELYQFYTKNQSIQDSILFGKRMNAGARLVQPSLFSSLHFICARKCRSDADAFFNKIIDGIGFDSRSDPAYKLHRALVENAASPSKKLPNEVIAKYFIKAWNASRSRQTRFRLNSTEGEAFPAAR